MNKKIADRLKTSIEAERKAIRAKTSSLDKRLEKAESVLASRKEIVEQPKVIRDTFSIPKEDYDLINKCKERGQFNRCTINKSEIIRAGLRLLASLSEEGFVKAVRGIQKVKTGRPKQKSM